VNQRVPDHTSRRVVDHEAVISVTEAEDLSFPVTSSDVLRVSGNWFD
jgi:hypothetical protein